MIINISWDSSVAGAPAGFQQAVQAAVQYFESTITSPVTLNLCFGWGEVAGQAIGAGSVSESVGHGSFYTYSTVAAALTAAATSADAQAAAATLPVGDPTHGGGFYVTSAEAKALGLTQTAPGGVDGYVGLNSAYTFTFDPNNRAVAGAYDAIGLIEHEIAEVLGRTSQDGVVLTDGPTVYTPMDLFKYASPGVRDFTPDASYFSVDGQTLLTQFNDATQNTGDAGDWATSAPAADAFDAFGQTGTQLDLSSTDLKLLNVLGYDLSPVASGAPQTPSSPTSAQATLTVTADASLAQGASLHVMGAAGVEIQGAASGQASPSFTNSGQINVDGSGPIEGVDEAQGSPFTGSTFTNAATGALYVDAASGAASGFAAAGASSAVDNAGLIQVVAESGDATGLANAGTGGFTNESTGQVVVWASGQALGVAMASFDNAGLVQATGASAIAVESRGAFANSGTIAAIDTAATGSVAVQIDALGLLTNTGTIRGDYAFQADDAAIASSSGGGSDIDLVNSGQVFGTVDLGQGPAEIHNTGLIFGKIVFGNANSLYDGAGGRQAGGIYLGAATNTVTLGDDGEVVFGGGVADTITGGAGDDFFVISRGNNVIDGGSGSNTLSFADAVSSVSVDLGAGTATADGSDTVRNIQRVIAGAFDATFTASASAATFVGGSGHDTFVGGAGNDTLIAGTGGSDLTGGGGNNTFIYGQGDKQVVITDFGANGDQDALHIYGYAAPESVVQQGADTLITLSATDSILLKNVDASSLTASEVVYSSGAPVNGPDTADPFGAPPVDVAYDTTIYGGETIDRTAVSGETYALVDGDPNGGSGVLPSIDNFGTVGILGTGTTVGGLYSVAGYTHGGTFTNEAGAQFFASAQSGAAYGINTSNCAPDVVNKGQFNIAALTAAAAYGVATQDPNFHFLNDSSGHVAVASYGGAGYGLSLGAAQVENDGDFGVSAGQGVGVLETLASGSGVITNTGNLNVQGATSAVDIQVGGTGGAVSITNSGMLVVSLTASGTAAAIQELAASSAHAPQVSLTNTGMVEGEVDLGQGQDTLDNRGGLIRAATAIADRNAASGGGGRLDIVNTGQIVGDIVLDGDGSYSGVGGEVSGDIYLADGSDTLDLRGGTLDSGDRIDIAPTQAGAAIRDVIYTGAGGGLVSLHAGDADLALTLTGQGTTTLQFDEASTAATWSRNADNSWTVHAGVDGTATVTGVTLEFTDRTVALGALAPDAHDFDGSGRADLLIENTNGAVVAGVLGAGGSETYSQVAALGPEWAERGAGDFLGEGHAQFLIENTSGAVVIGDAQGGTTTYTQLAALGSEWSFAGTGDFLGAGKSDFLIENTTGAIVVGEVGSTGKAVFTQVGQLGGEWKFAGSGDFLGEGHAQVLIENTKGAVVVGDVQGGKAVYTQVATLGSEWAFVGAGDFLGDGRTDMLIENAKGAIVVGEVGAGGQTTWTQVGLLGSEWKFVGAGDVRGLGRDQFLIENATGAVVAGEVSGGKAAYTQLGALGSEWSFRM